MNSPATDGSTLADALTLAIKRGDADGVKALCLSLLPRQRRELASLVIELGQQIKFSVWPASPLHGKWAEPPGPEHHRAHDLATLACGEPENMLTLVEPLGVRWEEASSFLQALGNDALRWRQALQTAAGRRLKENVQAIEPVQRLLANGLIDRPSGPDYTTALIAWPRVIHWQSPGGMPARLRADPGVYQALLEFFELQGTAELNLAAMEKYAKSREAHWPQIFLQGIEQGHYRRPQILEKTLRTLESDWPQMRAGWFSRFHQLLAPSASEMAPFSECYLGLTYSRIPPTVALALDALRALRNARVITAAALVPALAPVFYATAKAQVLAALKLLQSACAEDPAQQPSAVSIALPGLLHTAADVQGKVLGALKNWGLDDAQREALKTYSSGIARCHQALFDSLLGVDTALPDPSPQEPVPSAAIAIVSNAPSSDLRAIRPLHLDAEGTERIAAVLENPGDIDELESALAALVRLAPVRPELRKRCAPLLRRARRLKPGSLSFEFARLLMFVLQGERLTSGERSPSQQELAQPWLAPRRSFARRIDDLVEQAALGLQLDPLSTPSHKGGFLTPERLRERLAEQAARGDAVCEGESTLANQRSVHHPIHQARFDWKVSLPAVDDAHSLRHPEFEIAHLGVRLTEPPIELLGVAELRYAASTVPCSLEPFFAAGSLALARNLDWWEARWCNQAYIEPLLEPTTPLLAEFPMAILTLALALGGKQPGQTAMAVDAFSQAHRQGRLDVAALASTLQALFATPLPKAKRYATSLGSALHNDPGTCGPVFECLCGIVRSEAIQPIKDLGALLDVLLEAGLAGRFRIPEDLAELLRKGRGSPATRKKQQTLLAYLA